MFDRVKNYLMTPSTALHRWEVILLVTLGIAMFFCSWLSLQQRELAKSMVRMHVIANSDSEEDQALKLEVRDAVLEQAAVYLEEVADAETAVEVLSAHLEELAQVGQAVVQQEGYGYPVTAQLDETHFPTKYYDEFALPAGNYQALRVVIGAGEGENWWCVAFPTLCVSAASEWQTTAVSGGLSEEDVALMAGEDGYVLKFKCLEWLDWLKTVFHK